VSTIPVDATAMVAACTQLARIATGALDCDDAQAAAADALARLQPSLPAGVPLPVVCANCGEVVELGPVCRCRHCQADLCGADGCWDEEAGACNVCVVELSA
jgi:hypothetical protein